MTEMPPQDAELRLTVAELDAILDDVHPDGRAPTETPLEAGYHIGQVDATRQMHRAIIDDADVIIE